ncbi:MAG: VOC family protein [Burkholderiales bacterium]
MPVVTVQLWSGRTINQKRRLVAAITEAMVQHADAGPEHLHVVIQDVPKESWGRNGHLGSENEPDAPDPKPEKPPKILGFAHLLLQVADINASRHFYAELVGFTERRAKPLADGRPFVPFHQGIALTTGGPGKPAQIDHMAFRVKNVDALAAGLKKAGVHFMQDLHDGIYGRTIYIADPDGNKIELYEEPK